MSLKPRPTMSTTQLHAALASGDQFIADAGSRLAGEIAVVESTEKAVSPLKVKKESRAPVVVEKASVAPKIDVSDDNSSLPWAGIDDKVARPQLYSVSFPASTYAKLKFLGENEPGGPSVRKLVLDALESYIEEKLSKYTK